MFPAARSGMRPIKTGAWRDDRTGPMQVVSGPIGHERVHYEAPTAKRLNAEMRKFLRWFNAANGQDWVVKAAIAHLWFVTIHPFDDGNGRIARAIADMALARSDQSAQRFYSMSSLIQKKRAEYYAILERTQKGTTDITAWMQWFLETLGEALAAAERALHKVLRKAEFRKSVANLPLNERQRAMLNRLLEGFEGKLTTSKWAKLTKTSQDTAARDIAKLIELGVLVRNPEGGRSTSYMLASAP
jgi:Fic family protein